MYTSESGIRKTAKLVIRMNDLPKRANHVNVAGSFSLGVCACRVYFDRFFPPYGEARGSPEPRKRSRFQK